MKFGKCSIQLILPVLTHTEGEVIFTCNHLVKPGRRLVGGAILQQKICANLKTGWGGS